MLLRSSSTPVLGSLISSFSETPTKTVNNNVNNHHESKKQCHLPPVIPHTNHHNHDNKLLPHGTRNLPSVSCNSSPISPAVTDHLSDSHKGFRRVRSDGNLEGLAYACCTDEELNNTNQNQQPQMFSGRSKCLMLETIPSFSYSTMRGRREDEEDESDIEYEEEAEEEEEDEEFFERNIGKDRKRVMAMGGSEFSFENEMGSMALSEEAKAMDKLWNTSFAGENEVIGQQMYLAMGIGIGGGGGGVGGSGGSGGGDFYAGSGGEGGDNGRVEEHYRRMVEENPGNPLFLRNYAQFLYQSKKDLGMAEEYYSRAILADPGDGDILSQYAKLVWEHHGDEDRASSYFERAIQASPQDSNVQASYANFLWETEEDDDGCNVLKDLDTVGKRLHGGALASANV
ncbi:hypothetical protein Patl1_01699 [Pistacia atlantica]|uniref:Uncharacterized protein n=1 Tax=Pistacia atlantica TaxID=434234 RepID=A0ACC1C8U2_9ROSI|nr:hypothetical protein Patl1_01699 [Pistacia atlantica]